MREPDQTVENCLRDVAAPGYARLILVPVLAVVLVVVLLYPFPMEGRSWNAIFNLAHAPTFLMAFLFVVGILDPQVIGVRGSGDPIIAMSGRRIVLLAIALCLFGGLCEFGQTLVGRSASIRDGVANSTGVLAGMIWCVSRRTASGLKRLFLTAAAPAFILPMSIFPIRELLETQRQRTEFPLLASFERSAELLAWEPHEAEMTMAQEWASHGQSCLKLTGKRGTRFPGASFIWPVGDWRGYSNLQIDIHNPGDAVLQVRLNISDRFHATTSFEPTDRFRTVIDVPASSTQTVMIDLSEVASTPVNREMDLSQIALVDVHMTEADEVKTVMLDNIRLLK